MTHYTQKKQIIRREKTNNKENVNNNIDRIEQNRTKHFIIARCNNPDSYLRSLVPLSVISTLYSGHVVDVEYLRYTIFTLTSRFRDI